MNFCILYNFCPVLRTTLSKALNPSVVIHYYFRGKESHRIYRKDENNEERAIAIKPNTKIIMTIVARP